MAGIRLQPEDSDPPQARTPTTTTATTTTGDLISDDERSIAADSWSIKSDYGSTLDDDQRHADASDALAAVSFRAASDYSSDKEEEQGDGVSSKLGLQSYWDVAYSEEFVNFREHGLAGEVWFGADVMETVASWTKNVCTTVSRGNISDHAENDSKPETVALEDTDLSTWSVLDIGTGNGLLLQELAKHGFSDLTGVDYIEDAISLARGLAERDGYTNIKFMVDDVLETKLERTFMLVMDKGTLDAIGLHPDGPLKRFMYWDSVSKLVAPGGVLVITSCNSTKDELVQEAENFNRRRNDVLDEPNIMANLQHERSTCSFQYIDHVRTYPTFMFGGVVGSRVATVAFLRNADIC
ncbi:EEF1A lysine methyltransferase 2-like protein [Drosera capensis]